MYSKRCFKCLEIKPISEFYKHKRMGDGHLNKCKTCTKRDMTRHRERNLERSKSPRRIATITASVMKRPEREAARRAVRSAVASKKIVKPTACNRCGGDNSGKPLEGSHDDYNRPLAVEWLCRGCHVKKDRPRDYTV